MNSRFTAGLALIVSAILGAGAAISGEPFKDFTFKIVKPPAKGAKKLITIQITPKADKPADSAKEKVAGGLDIQTMNAWFWDNISPDLTAAGPGRFGKAQRIIANAPRAEHPGLVARAALQRIVAAHGTDILLATLDDAVSPALVLAMIGTEEARAKSDTALTTPHPLLAAAPQGAGKFKISDGPDPTRAIKAGVARFARLLRRFNNDPILALAAFQAGAKAIDDHSGVPPFAATRAYVPEVIAAFQVARRLCITPPELYSDGCVFLPKDVQ